MKVTKIKWMVIIISGIGMLLSTLDTGIINVALPFLEGKFHASTSLTALSVIGYTMSLAIFILPFGYLSDRNGKLKVSFVGLTIFGLGSVLCGAANSITALIIFRVLQGIGAAALQATSAALITTLMDKKYIPSALGIFGIMIGLGPVLGPSIGGLLLAFNLWRLIFWINVPFAIVGLICNYMLLRQISENKKNDPFDFLGNLINTLLVISLLSGFSLLSNQHHLVLGIILIVIGIIFAIIFYLVEKKQKSPLINFKTLNEQPRSWLYLGQTIVFGFASAMIFLLPPFIFEKLMGLNIGITGLLVLGAPVGLVIFSRISGKLNDGHKNSMFSLLGLGVIAFSLLGLAFSSQQAPAILITFFLFIYGIGGGFFQPANIAAIMQIGNNKNQSSLGALQRMVQNIAIASGTAIGSTIINLLSQKMVIGIRISWIITLFFVLIIVCLSRIFNRKEQII